MSSSSEQMAESARQPSPAPPAVASSSGSPGINYDHRGNHGSLSSRTSTSSLRANHPPPSPRSPSRNPSISQFSMADVLTGPPPPPKEGKGTRDWRTVQVGELIDHAELPAVNLDTPVETACQVLIDHGLSSIPILSSEQDGTVCGTVDYTDLNAFLLLIMGLYQPAEDEDLSSIEELARKARAGTSVPVKLVKDLGKKDPFITVNETDVLSKVVEILGSGVHRVAVVKDGTTKVIGIVSQLRLIRYFWEHGRVFPAIEALYPVNLRDLGLGSSSVISINGEKRVLDALELMNSEGVSSLPVVDNHLNVVGNISVADVKYLTRSSSVPLLKSTCFHFITVILTDRGLQDGKDSYPVFYVNPLSSLAHTVAKLVATQSHRMWIVDAPSPASSAPPTPKLAPELALPTSATASPPSPFSSPVAGLPSSVTGGSLGGRLSGVVSLTDILNLFARNAGLSPVDPNETRRQRRRSSSTSMRASIDGGRGSIDLRELREHRGSIEIRR